MQNEMKQRPMKLDDERWEKLKQKVGNVTKWWLAKVEEELASEVAQKAAPAAESSTKAVRAAPVKVAAVDEKQVEAAPVVQAEPQRLTEPEKQSDLGGIPDLSTASWEWGKMPAAAEPDVYSWSDPPEEEPKRYRLDPKREYLNFGDEVFELPFYKEPSGKVADSDGKPMPMAALVQVEKLVEKGKMAWVEVPAG